jgi:hypothetical protein
MQTLIDRILREVPECGAIAVIPSKQLMQPTDANLLFREIPVAGQSTITTRTKQEQILCWSPRAGRQRPISV